MNNLSVLLGKQFLIASGVVLAVGFTFGLSGHSATAIPSCTVAAGVESSPKAAEQIRELRQHVETGPLFALAATNGRIASCRIDYESEMITLEYQFRDGGWLRAKRDAHIEYSDQEVRFAHPVKDNPVGALIRTEQASFGVSGCGIDWHHAERQPAADDPTAIEAIYRGDVCNCQARVRQDAAGQVVGLLFRSAC